MPLIKIYYDNISVNKEVKPEWGFSALIKYNGRNVLFDTGGKTDVLTRNLKAMGSDPKYFEFVIISHEHWDHITGLSKILHSEQKVYLPASFSDKLKCQVEDARADLIKIKGFQQICPGIYTTGEMGGAIKEQSLIVDTSKGLIVMTGCSHPGIVEIVKKAKENLKKDVYFVIGGFHLYTMSDSKVRQIINKFKSLGVQKVAPCHCTGEKAISLFREEFGKDFIKVGSGSIIDTAKL